MDSSLRAADKTIREQQVRKLPGSFKFGNVTVIRFCSYEASYDKIKHPSMPQNSSVFTELCMVGLKDNRCVQKVMCGYTVLKDGGNFQISQTTLSHSGKPFNLV